jgi:hypothetical protein
MTVSCASKIVPEAVFELKNVRTPFSPQMSVTHQPKILHPTDYLLAFKKRAKRFNSIVSYQ